MLPLISFCADQSHHTPEAIKFFFDRSGMDILQSIGLLCLLPILKPMKLLILSFDIFHAASDNQRRQNRIYAWVTWSLKQAPQETLLTATKPRHKNACSIPFGHDPVTEQCETFFISSDFNQCGKIPAHGTLTRSHISQPVRLRSFGGGWPIRLRQKERVRRPPRIRQTLQ